MRFDHTRPRRAGYVSVPATAGTRIRRCSAVSVTWIRNGFGLDGRCEMARSHRFAQFLRCIGPLPTRLADARLRNRDVDDLSSCDLSSFERIHRLLRCSAIKSTAGNGKSPAGFIRQGFLTFKSLAVTYSCMPEGHTTIGAQRFHFRVRNGIGWFPLAIAARQTGSAY